MTVVIDDAPFKAIRRLPSEVLVLNVGSGEGRFDRLLGRKTLNLDVDPRRGSVDVVGDAHRLPFRTAVFDAVFSNAVLEHLPRPWIAAREMERVLKPGGIVSVNVPFLNVFHDVNDYFRFTADGLRELFEGSDEVGRGVSSGPNSFLTMFLVEYAGALLPKGPVSEIVKLGVRSLVWPLKYLDWLFRRSACAYVVADAVYFVGRRRIGAAEHASCVAHRIEFEDTPLV